jgi:hypothetical protein
VGQSMRVTGVLSDAGVGCQVLDDFIVEEGAVGYLCVEVYFATGRSYVCTQVVVEVPMMFCRCYIRRRRKKEREATKALI